jgi:serine protease AprX
MLEGTESSGTRTSVLWSDKTGRNAWKRPARLVAAATLAIAVAVLGGSANAWGADNGGGGAGARVASGLLAKATANPNATFRVIVQSGGGLKGAENAVNSALGGDASNGHLGRELGLVNGVAAEVSGKKLEQLASIPGLTVTEDAPAEGAQFTSTELWPQESGNAMLWGSVDGKVVTGLPAIAIVDSGVDTSREDVSGRVIQSVNLATATPNSAGDGRGHGTFVAGIAAGAASGHAGAAPAAPIVSLDVMNDSGMAWTSDVIAAAQWILQNKGTYNIRVANFSLHADQSIPFFLDPLDQAVEKLWFNGVVVVTAAGNYGTVGAPSGVKYAPGDDPFVITVGAADLGGTLNKNDDMLAPWSSYGYTLDGFWKPELTAPGRYMVGPVPTGSTLYSERPGQVVSPGYMQLSGTSFAVPVVSGAAAHILALHPTYTPDQVKGALMVTARTMPNDTAFMGGVGEVNAIQAATYVNPPNPNLGLDQFVRTDLLSGSKSFDYASWNSTALANASWNSASWNSASWNSASWNSASWNSASWNSASWNSASWNSASWNSASWNSMSAEDESLEVAVIGDYLDGGYPITDADLLAAELDPDFQPLTPLP